MDDLINKPAHYVEQSADGYEPIELCEQYGFCVGNAIKYLIRAGHKTNTPEPQDLKKARWYLLRHLEQGLSGRPCDGDLIPCQIEAFRKANRYIEKLLDVKGYAYTSTIASTIRMLNERLEGLQ